MNKIIDYFWRGTFEARVACAFGAFFSLLTALLLLSTGVFWCVIFGVLFLTLIFPFFLNGLTP